MELRGALGDTVEAKNILGKLRPLAKLVDRNALHVRLDDRTGSRERLSVLPSPSMHFAPFRFLSLSILCLVAPTSQALDLQQFVQETQRINRSGENVTIVWWIPAEYWADAFKQSPNISKAQFEQAMAVLEPYTMFVTVRVKIGAFASLTSAPRSEMLDALDLKFNGKSVSPVKEADLSGEMQNLLRMMKPIMGGMLGQIGQGLEFFICANRADGKTLIDPTRGGKLECTFYDQKMKWRLPLGSVLPAKIDEKTGESFPGNYNFNPFSGDPLKAKP